MLGSPPAVDYTLDRDGLTLAGAKIAFLNKRVHPLVLETLPSTSSGMERIRLVSGLFLPDNGGYIVLRPKTLSGPKGAEESFEASLLRFSLAPTRDGWNELSLATPPGGGMGKGKGQMRPWNYPRSRRGR